MLATPKPLISIIIPVYKTECYLKKCLDNASNQIYRNIEIIVVDDGSPGNCKEICDQYPDIIYIKNEKNRGLYYSRERGVRQASGVYIIHCDSDDWMDTHFCKAISRMKDFDLVVAEVVSILPRYREKSIWTNKGLNQIKSGNIFELMCNQEYKAWSMWGKAFRKDLALKVYEELSIDSHLIMGEDFIWFIVYAFYCKNTKVCHETSYYYNLTNESINRTEVTEETLNSHWKDLSLVINTFRNFCKKNNIPSNNTERLEQEMLYTFLITFLKTPKSSELLAKFLPKINMLFPPEFLTSYLLERVSQKRNSLLVMWIKIGEKIFNLNYPTYKFFRFIISALRWIFIHRH